MIVIFFLIFARGRAADRIFPAGVLSMPSTQQNGTARAMAMGSAYVSVADDSSALLWNPAGLGKLRKIEICLHHENGLGDLSREILVLAFNAEGIGGFGLSVNSGDNGLFENRDASGVLTGTDTAGSAGFVAGWGKEIFPDIFAGIALKAGRQYLAGREYSAFAGDVGFLWKASPSLNVGAAYYNIGGGSGNMRLASGLRIGVSYGVKVSDKFIFITALSNEIQTSGLSRESIGLEADINGLFQLRAGYFFNLSDNDRSGLTGFTAGAGIRFKNIKLDYACVPYDNLGLSSRISLSYQFLIKAGKSAATKAPQKIAEFIPKPKELMYAVFLKVQFKFDEYELDELAKYAIRKNISILQNNPGIRVLIEGHASKFGTEAYNDLLSLKRADAIKNFIIENSSISPDRLISIGYGDSRPDTYEYYPEDINSQAAKTNRNGVFSIIIEPAAEQK